MSLTSVKMSEDVWLTCLTHALSTETEEIMGLLLGDILLIAVSYQQWQYSKNGRVNALIWGASPQSRSDRRKDRVETNPEQLAAASAQAEISLVLTLIVLPDHVLMTAKTGRTTRVIGWYHSHPHITVFPSHVDVRTQAMYQLLDPGFIGLIFSCFSEDTNKGTRRPLELGDFFANADASYTGGGSNRLNCPTNNLENAVIDIDPMDMSDGMQEAMHRSNLDMSGAEYVRKEITLQVLPTLLLLNIDSPLVSLTDLQRVLFEEERGAYNQAITQNLRNGRVHPLAFIHHTSTYQASLCKLIEYCLSPAISALQDRLRENEVRLSLLCDEATFLETAHVVEPGSQSPVQAAASSPRGTVSPRQNPSGSLNSRGATSIRNRGP
ncbi:Lys-63-specific deubiquitinase BRCC36 [Linum perenne]